MIPELFRIGSFAITPFGVMLVAAFVCAYFQLGSGLRRLKAGDEEDASAILFWTGLCGMLGGKVYYAALYRDPMLVFDRAGIVWYGGFIGGLLAFLWVRHHRRLAIWPTLDAVGPALAVGYGVGRIGCFLVGDDYGRPTDLPWGVAFAHGLPPTTVESLHRNFGIVVPGNLPGDALVRVHPTQLYETLIALLIWGFGLWLLRRRPQPPGMIFLPILALLGAERFTVELLRAKDDRFLGGFTIAQAISAAIVFVAVILAQRRHAQAARP
ncbi:MAG: prolipoprotein diacylglyceryl transferase [Thermoanaerobaculia bacterium]|nr:prolipoprotein diacylglyceryl transferase [Thermoanaerobaculia bacterium]